MIVHPTVLCWSQTPYKDQTGKSHLNYHWIRSLLWVAGPDSSFDSAESQLIHPTRPLSIMIDVVNNWTENTNAPIVAIVILKKLTLSTPKSMY